MREKSAHVISENHQVDRQCFLCNIDIELGQKVVKTQMILLAYARREIAKLLVFLFSVDFVRSCVLT